MAFITTFAETSLVLDTDVFTHWRNQQPYVLKAIADYQSNLKRPPALTSITTFEALRGVERVVAKRGGSEVEAEGFRARIEALSELCGVLSFDCKAASIAAYLCAHLGDNLFKKHWRDIFIAATAITHEHGVATGNRSDYELIGNALSPKHPPLRLAIWKP